MDTQYILYLLVAFAVGCALAWVVSRSKNSNKNTVEEVNGFKETISALEHQNTTLKEDNKRLYAEIQENNLALANKIKDAEEAVKREYDILLEQIKEENHRLDSALKLAAEGKIEDSIKAQLLEAEKTAKRLLEMEENLDTLRLQHESLQKESAPLRDELEASKSECSKLNKRIKKLEEDLDEAEEEQESLEKKLKVKGTELQEANETIDKSSREIKQLHLDIEQLDNELTNRIDELKRKTGSIEFVQEILSAPETGAEDVKKLYRSIDFFESFLRGSFMDCNAYLFNTYPSLSFNDISGKAGAAEKKKSISSTF